MSSLSLGVEKENKSVPFLCLVLPGRRGRYFGFIPLAEDVRLAVFRQICRWLTKDIRPQIPVFKSGMFLPGFGKVHAPLFFP